MPQTRDRLRGHRVSATAVVPTYTAHPAGRQFGPRLVIHLTIDDIPAELDTVETDNLLLEMLNELGAELVARTETLTYGGVHTANAAT